MAQIFVFGRVMNDLVPKESQSKQSYVCFDLMERTKNWTQFYQVWAWDADVTRLMQFKVKKGSVIWLAGSQRLVDVRMKDGKLEKKLKVSLNDFGFLPKQPAAANRQENDPDITAEPAPPLTEVLDGDRESLPESFTSAPKRDRIKFFRMKLKAWCGPSFFVFQQIQKKGWYQT